MGYEEIIYTVENNNIAVITINRPDRMNALTQKTHDEISRAIVESDKDSNIRVIVITGSGRGFCSGDDVKVIFGGGGEAGQEESFKTTEETLKRLQGKEERVGGGFPLLFINKPTIAAVNGAAVGYGCDLALMCDMRVASENAKFGEVFLRVGLIPDESLIVLPRLVGLAKAYELMLTTDIIDAQEAERIGLVNKVVPHEQLMTATMELATKLANKPPIAVQLAKEGIRRGLGIPHEEFKRWHSIAMQFCMSTEDHKEGSRAFVEKREPVFKGR